MDKAILDALAQYGVPAAIAVFLVWRVSKFVDSIIPVLQNLLLGLQGIQAEQRNTTGALERQTVAIERNNASIERMNGNLERIITKESK